MQITTYLFNFSLHVVNTIKQVQHKFHKQSNRPSISAPVLLHRPKKLQLNKHTYKYCCVYKSVDLIAVAVDFGRKIIILIRFKVPSSI